MKTTKQFLMAAVLTIAGSSVLFTACKRANTEEKPATQVENAAQVENAEQQEAVPVKVESNELIRTSQSWDGVELPDYPTGRPELVAMKYVFPAGQKLGWHHHPVRNYGVLVEGELTIIGLDGKEKVVHAGEAVVEMVGTVHHGENRGTKPAVLYMFYLSQKDLPLAVQHPEIEQE